MIYISKGIVGKGSTTELVQVIRGGRSIYLSGREADLWLKGRFSFSFSQTAEEERTLHHLVHRIINNCHFHLSILPIAQDKKPQRSPLRLRFLSCTLESISCVNIAVI